MLVLASGFIPAERALAAQTDQATGSIAGTVTTAVSEAAAGAEVSIVELRRRVSADAEGAFGFEDVPPGSYLLLAESPRFGRRVRRVEVRADQEVRVELTLDVDVHHEVVIVTAQPGARSAAEFAQPVAVLDGQALRLEIEPTLGETLSKVPGVSSTYFGPGASRPIIRGIGGDRIRVLEDGIGTFDASSTSPDHAVSYDPVGADSIEIVRGPATLLYGSAAVGGVVNTSNGRIPETTSDHTLSGIVDLAGGTVADERSGAAALRVGRGPFVARGEYSRRQTQDLSIPGFAESEALRAAEEESEEEHAEEEQEEAFGTLPNSAVDNQSASISAGFVGRKGFLGLSVSDFDSLYGVPGAHGHDEEGEEHHEEGEEHDEERPVRIDMEQRRVDLRGAYTEPFGGFRTARIRFGVADYEHVELEGDEIGTTFNNDAWEGRLEMVHRPWGAFSGTFGAQLGGRDFDAVGAEAFLPPTETRGFALFAFEKVGTGAVAGQLGLRWEHQSVDAVGDDPLSRSFDGVSGSAGLLWSNDDGFGASLTLARSEKLPNAEELYSNGPHLATRAFEIGDPDLEKESSLGLDLALRKSSGRFTGQLSFFGNWFDGYIFEERTGEVEDGLDVVQFVQKDARFVGAEVEAHFDLLETEPHHLDLEITGDLVRAKLTSEDQNLPRIPPARYGVALHYSSDRWNARIGVRGVLEQDRIGPDELPTDGYTFLNASVGYRFFLKRAVLDVTLRGTNLADAEGRVHSSFLKDVAPLPGRDVRLNARLVF